MRFELCLSQLKRTFCNLVTNAIEASNFKGAIQINLKFQMNGLQLKINDNGIGRPSSVRSPLRQACINARGAIGQVEALIYRLN